MVGRGLAPAVGEHRLPLKPWMRRIFPLSFSEHHPMLFFVYYSVEIANRCCASYGFMVSY